MSNNPTVVDDSATAWVDGDEFHFNFLPKTGLGVHTVITVDDSGEYMFRFLKPKPIRKPASKGKAPAPAAPANGKGKGKGKGVPPAVAKKPAAKSDGAPAKKIDWRCSLPEILKDSIINGISVDSAMDLIAAIAARNKAIRGKDYADICTVFSSEFLKKYFESGGGGTWRLNKAILSKIPQTAGKAETATTDSAATPAGKAKKTQSPKKAAAKKSESSSEEESEEESESMDEEESEED